MKLQFHTYKHLTLSVLLATSLNLSSTDLLAAIDLSQFESSEAAVILGVSAESDLTEVIVQKAFRRLAMKFHPDKKSNEFTENQANEILKKLNLARTSLINVLKAQKELGSQGPEAHAPSTGSAPGSYSWSDFSSTWSKPPGPKETPPPPGSLTPDLRSPSDLDGTLFEGLDKDVHTLVINLQGHSSDIRYKRNALIVMRRDSFPIMEAWFYDRSELVDFTKMLGQEAFVQQIEAQKLQLDLEGLGPQDLPEIPGFLAERENSLSSFKEAQDASGMQKILLTYASGIHINAIGERSEGLVMPDGKSYFMPSGNLKFMTKPILGTPPGVHEAKAIGINNFLIGFGPSLASPGGGVATFVLDREISAGHLMLVERADLARSELPHWRNVSIEDSRFTQLTENFPAESDLHDSKEPAVTATAHENKSEKVTSILSKNAPPQTLSFRLIYSQEINQGYQEIFQQAMSVVFATEFSSTTFIPHNGKDSKLLPDFEINVLMKTPEVEEAFEGLRALGYRLEDVDAFTTTPKDGPQQAVFLFDKLTMIQHGRSFSEHPAAFVKLIVAIGHELHGNIAGALSGEELKGLAPGVAQIRQEVQTYRIGIQFIESLMEQQAELGTKTQKDLRDLLEVEKVRLAQWGEGQGNGKIVRSCKFGALK